MNFYGLAASWWYVITHVITRVITCGPPTYVWSHHHEITIYVCLVCFMHETDCHVVCASFSWTAVVASVRRTGFIRRGPTGHWRQVDIIPVISWFPNLVVRPESLTPPKQRLYHQSLHSTVRQCRNVGWNTVLFPTWWVLRSTCCEYRKRAVRSTCQRKASMESDPLFKILSVMKINYIYTHQVSAFMYKYSANMLPINFINYFTKSSAVHVHNSSIADNFHLSFSHSTLRLNSIRHAGPRIWNNLPQDLKVA